MADTPAITRTLLELYRRDDWITRWNFRCFLRLSGLVTLPRTAHILDCGCALGNLLRRLKGCGFVNLTGIDASPEMAVGARTATGLPVIEADVLDLAQHLRPRSQDAIVIADLLHHLHSTEEWERFLRQCREVLRPGGCLVIREPEPTLLLRVLYRAARWRCCHIGPLRPRLQSFIDEDALFRYFFTHWVDAYPALLTAAGFRITRDTVWLVHRITVCRPLAPATGQATRAADRGDRCTGC